MEHLSTQRERDYRTARNALLDDEIKLPRRRSKAVARRAPARLQPGGELKRGLRVRAHRQDRDAGKK